MMGGTDEQLAWTLRACDGVRLVWLDGGHMITVVSEIRGRYAGSDERDWAELGRASYLTRAMIRATLEEGLRRIKEADDAAQRNTGT